MIRSTSPAPRLRLLAGLAALAVVTTACGGDDDPTSAPTTATSSATGTASATGTPSTTADAGKKTKVALITKTNDNPFFIAMAQGAKEAGEKSGVEVTLAAGKEDGDEEGQITAIQNAVSAGVNGILITPNGPGVNNAIKKARDGGVFVIALDTIPDPADVVDITFATDNYKAGQLIGQWAAKQMNGEKAVIALIDLFDDKVVSVDYNRDQGFLNGMGIELKDPKKNGDEAKTGKYSGGDYEIVCNEAAQGNADGGRTAMENCLSKNKNINLVYTLNEPTADGAYKALQQAGGKALIVSVDGGCNPGMKLVKSGVIGATSQQYPVRMASLGVEAIDKLVKTGEKPTVTSGLDFFDTGVELVTDKPVDGIKSLTSDEGTKVCWGK